MTDSARQRTNMVESQIRPSDVTDRRILRAMGDVAREAFVPEGLASLAYMDEAVALSSGPGRRGGRVRTLMSPRVFAKLVQLLEIEATDTVLIVGAGRGYSAAILARIAGRVTALESDKDLAALARTALAGLAQVAVLEGSLPEGAPAAGPFDCILVDGAIPGRPLTLLGQLRPGGRLAAVLQDGAVGQATVWRRTGDHFGETNAFEATAGPLPGFETRKSFAL